jgi:hypothetical protein
MLWLFSAHRILLGSGNRWSSRFLLQQLRQALWVALASLESSISRGGLGRFGRSGKLNSLLGTYCETDICLVLPFHALSA